MNKVPKSKNLFGIQIVTSDYLPIEVPITNELKGLLKYQQNFDE